MSYHVISMLTAFYVNKSINQSIKIIKNLQTLIRILFYYLKTKILERLVVYVGSDSPSCPIILKTSVLRFASPPENCKGTC